MERGEEEEEREGRVGRKKKNRNEEMSAPLPEMGFPDSSKGQESACNVGDLASIPGSERSMEEGMATHSSILAWRMPWAEEPGRLQSMGSQRGRHD